MIVYDFNQPDLEDRLPRERGMLTPPDRVPIAKTLLQFGFVMVVGFLVLLQVLLETERWIPAMSALLLVAAYLRFFGGRGNSPGVLVVALRLFLVRSLVSLGAAVSALLLLWLGSRTRIQTLRMPVRVFCWSFVALLSIDILLGARLGMATPIDALAWNPFRTTLLGRLLGLLPTLAAWSILHVGLIIALAALVTGAEIFIERWFRPKVASASAERPCVHLSDLHVTAGSESSIEKHRLSIADLLNYLQAEVAAATGPIALTGDITDAGTREQWHAAISAIEAGRALGAKAAPVLLVPGNHDLFPYMEEFRPLCSAVGLGSRLVPLRKLRYLEAAARLCPELYVGDEPKTLLTDRLRANSNVLNAFAAGEDGLKDVVDDLWESCFPLHCVIGLQAFVILDTNRPAMSFVTAAFGEVATPVWRRLDSLLLRFSSRPGLQVVVLGHHHLYTPIEKRTQWRVKWLEIVCRRDLLRLLSRRADYYLHGHRHLAFNCTVGRLKISSAPSLRDHDNQPAKSVSAII